LFSKYRPNLKEDLFSKYRPNLKEDLFSKFLRYSRIDLIEQAKNAPEIFKMMGIMFFITSIFIFIIQFKEYFYVKNLQYFEETKSMTCRIDSVKTQSFFSVELITIFTKNNEFVISKDERYLIHRNLLKNDSITIEYFQ